MELSQRVRELLVRRSWTQVELARASGVEPATVCRLLSRTRAWRPEHVASVAAAFSLSPEELVKGTTAEAVVHHPLTDTGFVDSLLKANAAMVVETQHLRTSEEMLGTQAERLAIELEEARARCTAPELRLEDERRDGAVDPDASRQGAAVEVDRIRRELAAERAEVRRLQDQVRRLNCILAASEAAHAHAVRVANRNYGIAHGLLEERARARGQAAGSALRAAAAGAAVTLGLVALLGAATKPTKAPAPPGSPGPGKQRRPR